MAMVNVAEYAVLPRIVLDNGSGFLKVGMASNKRPPYVFPNCVGKQRKKFGSRRPDGLASLDDVEPAGARDDRKDSEGNVVISDNCYTLYEYFCDRPHTNGLLYDPNRQRAIWDRLIGRNLNNANYNFFGVDPAASAITITEPNLCPIQCRQSAAEVLFEDYGYAMVAFISAQEASCHLYDQLSNKSANLSTWFKNMDLYGYPQPRCTLSPPLNTQCCMVLDVGFGASHVVPFVNGEPIQSAALRINLGGFHLNAFLKNILAQRCVNLEFNELVVQHIKEEGCYVSRNFDLEIRAAKELKRLGGTQLHHVYELVNQSSRNKKWLVKYFNHHKKAAPPLLNRSNEAIITKLANGEFESLEGIDLKVDIEETGDYDQPSNSLEDEGSDENYLDDENEGGSGNKQDGSLNDPLLNVSGINQFVDLFNERFSVPELLFSPQDYSVNECGLVDLVYRSLTLLPQVLQQHAVNNIFLVGGSAKCPGFVDRLYNDLRCMLPHDWHVGIYTTADPDLATYYGAQLWTLNDSGFLKGAMTRMHYMEHGGVFDT